MFRRLFSFFWDRSLLIFLIIGVMNTLISMVGSQLLLFQMLASTNAFAISMHNPSLYKKGQFFQGVRNLFLEGVTLEVGVGYVVPSDLPLSDITKEYIGMLEKTADPS